MYIVKEAFDDNTANILDIGTYMTREMSEIELIRFSKDNNVMGLSVSNNKINYISAYNCTTFVSEREADEYILENELSYQNKMWIHNMWWVFERANLKKHVDYYIGTYKGDEITYLSESGYTPYIQGAKKFDKRTAQKRAAIMTNNSKTGTFWKAIRVVV